ncbi:class I SAM-dependent methyltransferase [Planctomicrobium piriforme]
MSRGECDWLAEKASTAAQWTEIGAYCGRSTLCVALHLPKGGSLRIIDTNLGTISRSGQTLFTTYLEIVQRRPDLEIIMARIDSAVAASRLPDSDVVFLDGAHHYEQVSADIRAWGPKCRLLCGHDFNPPDWPGVVQAVKELIPCYAVVAGSIWERQI